MAMRESLGELVARVRVLIGDTGDTPVFEDADIAAALDTWRTDMHYAQLTPTPVWTGPIAEYFVYTAPLTDWEADAVLYDSSNSALTPLYSDLQAGRWEFAENTPPPVYIVGKSYDVYAAAADMLEAWAARVALDFDFSADGGQFSRSQKRGALMAVAEQYRRRSRPRCCVMVHKDINTTSWGR